MEIQEKKQEIWDSIVSKYSHLEEYCTIESKGIDNDDVYFHVLFNVNQNFFIKGQIDVNNVYLYAIDAYIKESINTESFTIIRIESELIEPLVIGYYSNKELVELALSTLIKLKKHINSLEDYTTKYITQILMGNSVQEITESFVNELRVTNKLISLMQNKRV